MNKTYKILTEPEKKSFKSVCDKNYGKSKGKCETGEPLYFTADALLIPTQPIIDLLFNSNKN